MLEEFKNIYDVHLWLRYVTWMGLLSAASFLLWLSGGFPPQAWRLLIQAMPELPHAMRSLVILFPLAALTALSVTWLIAWCSLLCFGFILVRHHSQQRRRKGEAAWMPSRKHTHNQPYTDSQLQALLMQAEYAKMEDNITVSTPRLRLPDRLQEPMQELRSSSHSTHPAPIDQKISSVFAAPAGSGAPITRSRPVHTLEVGVGWNTGIKRKNRPNEDNLVVLQGTCTHNEQLVPWRLFIVADGMGGHDHGQEASCLAIQTMTQSFLQNIVTSSEFCDDLFIDVLMNGVVQANEVICRHNSEKTGEMGTTLTAALLVDTKAYVVNVGDSRTYLYRRGEGLSQITLDHSLVARLVAVGAIMPEDVYTHPRRSEVYRSLGEKESVEVDWFMVDLCRDDWLLLCSDGLWEMVRDPEIELIMRSGSSPSQVSDMLVQAALQGGGADNISVIVARVTL